MVKLIFGSTSSAARDMRFATLKCLLVLFHTVSSIDPFYNNGNLICEAEVDACNLNSQCKECVATIGQATKPVTCDQFVADHLNFFSSPIAGCNATEETDLARLAMCVAENRAAFSYKLSDCYSVTDYCNEPTIVVQGSGSDDVDGSYAKIIGGSANPVAIENWIKRVAPLEPTTSCELPIEIVKNDICDFTGSENSNVAECGYDSGSCCAATCSGASCTTGDRFLHCIDTQLVQHELILLVEEGEELVWILEEVRFSDAGPTITELYRHSLKNGTSNHPSAASGEWQCLQDSCTEFSTEITIGCIDYALSSLNQLPSSALNPLWYSSGSDDAINDAELYNISFITFFEGQEYELFTLDLQQAFIVTLNSTTENPDPQEIKITEVTPVNERQRHLNVRARDRYLQTTVESINVRYEINQLASKIVADDISEKIKAASDSGTLLANFRDTANNLNFSSSAITATDLTTTVLNIVVDNSTDEIDNDLGGSEGGGSTNLALILGLVITAIALILIMLIWLCHRKSIQSRVMTRFSTRTQNNSSEAPGKLFLSDVILAPPWEFPKSPIFGAPPPPLNTAPHTSAADIIRQASNEEGRRRSDIAELNQFQVEKVHAADIKPWWKRYSLFKHKFDSSKTTNNTINMCCNYESSVHKRSYSLKSGESDKVKMYIDTEMGTFQAYIPHDVQQSLRSVSSRQSYCSDREDSNTYISSTPVSSKNCIVIDLSQLTSNCQDSSSLTRSCTARDSRLSSVATTPRMQWSGAMGFNVSPITPTFQSPNRRLMELEKVVATFRKDCTTPVHTSILCMDNCSIMKESSSSQEFPKWVGKILEECVAISELFEKASEICTDYRLIAWWASDVKTALECLETQLQCHPKLIEIVDSASIALAEDVMSDLVLLAEGCQDESIMQIAKEMVLKATRLLSQALAGLPLGPSSSIDPVKMLEQKDFSFESINFVSDIALVRSVS